jgi:hypothetical protein
MYACKLESRSNVYDGDMEIKDTTANDTVSRDIQTVTITDNNPLCFSFID